MIKIIQNGSNIALRPSEIILVRLANRHVYGQFILVISISEIENIPPGYEADLELTFP